MFRDQASYTVDNKTGSNGEFVSPWKEGQLGAVIVARLILMVAVLWTG